MIIYWLSIIGYGSIMCQTIYWLSIDFYWLSIDYLLTIYYGT